jgi:hypothetical protein
MGKISHFREKNKKIPFSPPPVTFATIKIGGIYSPYILPRNI